MLTDLLLEMLTDLLLPHHIFNMILLHIKNLGKGQK